MNASLVGKGAKLRWSVPSLSNSQSSTYPCDWIIERDVDFYSSRN